MKEFSPIAFLTKDQVEQIHKAVLRVLSETGIHLPHAEAHSVPWYNQTQDKEFPLEINRVYFGAGSDSLYVTDRKTEEVRRARLQDVIDNVRVLETLPGFDFVMSMGLPDDVEETEIYPAVFREMLIHSTKPIVATSTCLTDLEIPYEMAKLEMAKLVAGSADAFRERPFCITYVQPESPFKYEDHVVERLWFCGEKGIPTMGVASPNLGGGGPVTMEGALVQGAAESLAALVILQLKFPKAGFIFGSNSWATDMRTSIVCYGSPECATSTAAYADMGRFYNLPSWGGAGCTDAQQVDAQAGAGCTDAQYLDAQAGEEAFQSILLTLQSGATVVHDVGFLSYGSLYDARFLVLNDEMITRARHMWRPLQLTEENLALSVIDDVARASASGKGPTMYLPPSYIERGIIQPKAPSTPLLDKLGERVEKILSGDADPTLPTAIVEKLRAF
jgi:trimethylamine--corrinoid protein Co-methyltransferase